MIYYKQGVQGDLNRKPQKALGRIGALNASRGQDTIVTAIRDGNHMMGSFHYIGEAFDFRKGILTKSDVQAACGPGFDVVEHSTHFHVEYDPKD